MITDLYANCKNKICLSCGRDISENYGIHICQTMTLCYLMPGQSFLEPLEIDGTLYRWSSRWPKEEPVNV